MQKQEDIKNIFKYLASSLIWLIQMCVWAYVWWNRYRPTTYVYGYRGSFFYICVYGLILALFTRFYGGYRVGYYRMENLMLSSIIGLLITNTIAYLQICLVGRMLVEYTPVIAATILQTAVICVWTYCVNKLYGKMFPPHQMLLIYGGGSLAGSLAKKMLSRSEKFHIQEMINDSVQEEEMLQKILQYESVILCDLSPKLRNNLLKFCFGNSIRTYTTPKISDILIRSAQEINLFDTPLILNRNQYIPLEQRISKRIMDIAVSLVGLVVLSPVMFATAVAIKLYDGGPILFKQKRCTKDNKVFTLMKFRSMIVDAEKDGKSQPAVENDVRVTPVGRIIRATRIDELPQFLNVLKGDMSVVGPRPERIEHVQRYTAEIPEFSFRSKFKAGLTGYAQVVGRYNTSAYDKLKMDLMYIANYSLLEDIKLMFLTVKIIFIKSSTEGF